MSYLRKQGKNIVSIRVHSFGDKSIWYTIIALVVGIFIGVVMKFCLDAETLCWIVHNLFDPVETLFMNALIMVAAPMIFFLGNIGYRGHVRYDGYRAHGRQADFYIHIKIGGDAGAVCRLRNLVGSHAAIYDNDSRRQFFDNGVNFISGRNYEHCAEKSYQPV